MANNCFSVIIAGGKGTRFWPLSRAKRPKQLLKILSRKSLIDETAERVYALGGRKNTLVVTIADQVDALSKELRSLPKSNFLAEPQGKNTAPCIGLAALEVLRRNPDAVMVVLPADHWVTDGAAFRRTLKMAVRSRHKAMINWSPSASVPTIRKRLWIHQERQIASAKRIAALFLVKRFTEKPTRSGSAADPPGAPMEQRHLRLEGFNGARALARYQPVIAAGFWKLS